MVNKEFYINFFFFIKQMITVNLKQGGVSCKIGINNYNMIEIIVKKIENEKDFFLSIKKVALILSVSNQTVINLIKKKNIKYIKVGKLYKIPKQSLIEYITNNLY